MWSRMASAMRFRLPGYLVRLVYQSVKGNVDWCKAWLAAEPEDQWWEVTFAPYRFRLWLEKWCWPWSMWARRSAEHRELIQAIRGLTSNSAELTKQFKLWRQQSTYGYCEEDAERELGRRPTNRERLAALDPEWARRNGIALKERDGG